jgi:hypothetical protein
MRTHSLILALSLALAAGCSKKEKAAVDQSPSSDESAVTTKSAGLKNNGVQQAPEQQDALPGASDVRNALAKKDYTGAVERLQLLKGIASNDQLWSAYRELSGEVGITLAEAAKTDAKAQQALGTYRLMMYGR